METSLYLILIVGIFVIDALVAPIFLSKNAGETELPKSPDLGDWWRSILVSDMADENGDIKGPSVYGKSLVFLIMKVAVVAVLAWYYFTNSGGKLSPKIVNIVNFAIIAILSLKYIAYAGWFDDKQCANSYVSSFKSDRPEDIFYKVGYWVFGILLAIMLRTHIIRTSEFTLVFLMVLPFIFYGLHWLTVRFMYLGCENTQEWFTWVNNKCAISPASFYREYVMGTADKADTASQSWDIYRRVAMIIFFLVMTYVFIRNYVSPSHVNTPQMLILVTFWIAFGLPLLLNWFSTVDLERKLADKMTNTVTQKDQDVTRVYKDWSCVVNKYGGFSAYFLLLCVQLVIVSPKLF
jgi:hypothetical protein